METVTIQAGGESMVLYPQKVAYWPGEKIAFVADMHLGKGASRRSHALYTPQGSDLDDLNDLKDIVEKTGAERLIILGDLFHDSYVMGDETLEIFSHWLEGMSAEVTLLIGNHDRKAMGKIDRELSMEIQSSSYVLGDFWLSHEPEELEGFYNLCGHLHPGVRMRDKAGCTHKSKAFWVTPSKLVLPAFGTTTSMTTMPTKPNDMLYICANNGIFPISVK